MNQKLIGEFIAELRREHGLTQRELAEKIHVSDKTVSKWECGKGLPEMSNIPILCRVLGISINELLSGERLGREGYTEKAEENIMSLMQETAEHKRKNKSAMTTILLSLFGVMLTVSVTTWFAGGLSPVMFFDLPSLLPIMFVTWIVLVAGGQWRAFCRAFSVLRKGKQEFSENQITESTEALEVAGKTWFAVGCLLSISTLIFLGGILKMDSVESFNSLLRNCAIALLAVLYGIAGYLFLLPIRARLKK
ncbi:MAG: helix-turn-helix transcriptional regulator [Lachnospiraceae bacterium]|nr:helix-turn-helix transcriptional regulator [Lachnospiraceae bacterium]